MHEEDRDLVRRWQYGDSAAFEGLVRRWQQPLARFLARLLGSAAPVADVCQEVFLRVHLSRERYRDEGNFSTWLYRIALNLARDHIRKHARLPIALREEVPLAARSDPPLWERRELQEVMDEALGQLTPPLREVLVLRHYAEMNFETMARLLETPASTLKSRFAVALRQMQAILQSLGYGEEEATP